MRYAIGVDIGGSHISCAAVDLDKRVIIGKTAAGRPVDNKAEASAIIDVWAEAIGETLSLAGENGLEGIGFAMPGPFDYVNGICLIKGVPKYERLYGTDVGKAITRKLDLPAEYPVRFMNDASSFAAGEAWAGKASAYKRIMAITLGTGFGSAFIESRVPVVTGDRVPDLGCVYHISYHDGIADDYFSTRWFTKRFFEIKGYNVEGVLEVSDAASEDPSAMAIFNEFGANLGEFLSPWLKKFGAEALVIGGNISRAYNLFGSAFENELIKDGCLVKPFISDLKEDAALIGSAFLLDNEYWLRVKDSLRFM